MSAGAQSDPRHDADVLLTPPQIYVARSDCDGDVIDAEQCRSALIPDRILPRNPGKPPARQQLHHARSQHFRKPPPNVIDPQPWRRSNDDWGFVSNSGRGADDDLFELGDHEPSIYDQDGLYPDPQVPGRKTHVLFGIFEDAFGLYFFISHTARRYLFLTIAVIVLLSLGKLAEAVEFVIHFIF